MNVYPTCRPCGCAAHVPAHAVLAALREDDVDAAIELGLLDAAPCPSCGADCNTLLLRAREERRFALAARERYRDRAARLQRRAAERQARRTPPAQEQAGRSTPDPPALPSAAAAALARAKAKAAARHRP